MKRLLWIALIFFAAFGSAAVQEDRKPIRIQIRHADPWYVKGMLEGQPLMSPEISTLLTTMGVPTGAVHMIDKMFEDGIFMVAPADNSLWWIPNRKGR
jgi:hypothetical protein